MSRSLEKRERIMAVEQGLAELGLVEEFKNEMRLARSPFHGTAEEFLCRLESRIEHARLDRIANPPKVFIPDVPAEAAINIIREEGTDRQIVIHRDVSPCHFIVGGSTGCGKSNALRWLAKEFSRHEANIEVSCIKDEGLALPTLFEDALVVQPQQITENLFTSPNPALRQWYQTCVFQLSASNFAIVPGTWQQSLQLVPAAAKWFRITEDELSFKDLENFLKFQGEQGRERYASAGFSFGALCGMLGRTARIRRGVKPKARFKINWWFGVDGRTQQFLASLGLLRTQMEAMTCGHGTDLRLVYISDEGGLQLKQSSLLGQVSFVERQFTQLRSFGVSLLFAVQSISDVPEIIKGNTGTFIFGRTPSLRDAREVQQLIGLSDAQTVELQHLPPGKFFMRSIGFSGPLCGWFPRMDINRYPSIEEINALMAHKFAALEREIAYSPEVDDEPSHVIDTGSEEPKARNTSPAPSVKTAGKDFQWTEDHYRFLDDIRKNPDASVVGHYKNADITPAKGKIICQEILAASLAVVSKRPTKGRSGNILSLTELGIKKMKERQT